MSPDLLKLVQHLATMAAPAADERTVTPDTTAATDQFVERVYELFARNGGPAWSELDAALRNALHTQVTAQLWPLAKPFETEVARLAIDMMAKRDQFLAALLNSSADNPLERVHRRTAQDEAQFAMDDAVKALERLLSNYKRRSDAPADPKT